jgi:hypothetical protein
MARCPKRRWGEKATGSNPTDRGQLGTKRSLLTDGHGIPVAVAVDGAKRPDMKLVAATLHAFVVAPPTPTAEAPPPMCLDKGYAYKAVRATLDEWGYTAHIRQRGEAIQAKRELPGSRARRWVAERMHSWMNRFRCGLIRWEKKGENYVALVHFACA